MTVTIELAGAAFLASTREDIPFYKGFDAKVILGETPFGPGIVIFYSDSQNIEKRKIFPSKTITDWWIQRTISKGSNHRGFTLRIVVPLPDFPGRHGHWQDWYLTVKTFDGWDNFTSVRDKCIEIGMPGPGLRH